MNQKSYKWVIRKTSGQMLGPYSTDDVLKIIRASQLNGDEMISRIPGGAWGPISQEPAFYDFLLESLDPHFDPSAHSEPIRDVKPLGDEDDDNEATQIGSNSPFLAADAAQKLKAEAKNAPSNALSFTKTEMDSSIAPGPAKAEIAALDSGAKLKSTAKPKVPDIELSNLKKRAQEKEKNQKLLPLIGIVMIALSAIYIFWEEPQSEFSKIRLVAPNFKNKVVLNPQQLAAKVNESIQAINLDTFNSYMKAQNILVNLIEADQQNMELRGLLCVTYNYLWPFSFQDDKDRTTINEVLRSTKSLNVVSPYSLTCESVALMTSNRIKEARTVIETALESTAPFTLSAFLYEFKGEILTQDNEDDVAYQYIQKSQSTYPQWLRPYFELAKINRKKKEFGLAASQLRELIKNYPNHIESQFLLGTIEHRDIRKSESAFAVLQQALKIQDRASEKIYSEALFSLGEIYLSRSEKSQALKYAEEAFRLSPSNQAYKQLVVRLGGAGKVSGASVAQNELIFIGDQYFRKGDFLAAQAEYKSAFELDPKNAEAATKAAKALWNLNQTYEALDWLKKAAKANPKYIQSYVLLSDYLSQRFDFQNAELSLVAGLKMAPNNFEILRGYALLELRKNNLDLAITFGQRAAKAYDADIETYIILGKANALKVASMQPINSKEVEKRSGHMKDAIRFSTRAIEIDAANVEAQAAYALTMAKVNGVDSGLTYLSDLIRRYSYVIDYRVAYIELLMSEERYSAALEMIEKLVGQESRNKKLIMLKAVCQRALGLDSKAIATFLDAAILDPSDAEPMFQIGKMQIDQGKYAEAVKSFSKVVSQNRFYPRAHFYLGRAYYLQGDLNLALAEANEEKKMNPNLADAYILTAEIMTARKQYQDCAGEYSMATKLRSEGAEIYVKTAACYRLSGSLDLAEDMLTLAAQRESGFADIYKEQGAIFELRNALAEAAAAYNKYLNLSPNAPDKAQIEGRILRLNR